MLENWIDVNIDETWIRVWNIKFLIQLGNCFLFAGGCCRYQQQTYLRWGIRNNLSANRYLQELSNFSCKETYLKSLQVFRLFLQEEAWFQKPRKKLSKKLRFTILKPQSKKHEWNLIKSVSKFFKKAQNGQQNFILS